MNPLKSIYFPATDIYSIRQYPIFLLFQKLHMIQPVENQDSEQSQESTDIFIKSGFCQVDTPSPLGENRKRFLQLVEDISKREDDYAAQLSALTLAAMSNKDDNSESSEQAIINQLFTTDTKQLDKEKKLHEGKLWKARLVLSIGEILDREEEEIAKNLSELDDDTAGLMKALHGDETEESENPFDELMQIENKLGAARAGNEANRFRAWKTLFFESRLQDSNLFITTSSDAGDLLIEEFERQSGVAAKSISGLSVPGLIGFSGEEAWDNVQSFCEKNQALIANIQKLLTNFQEGAIKEHRFAEFNDTIATWNSTLEEAFPEIRFGRVPCELYIFPDFTCASLLKSTKQSAATANGILLVID
jgi:hypothetical protein